MKGVSYKWLVMVVVIFGLFMVMLDLTIVNIAVPSLQNDFGASLSDVSWVSTGYSLAEGIGIPLTPYFSALLGNKRFYLVLLALFTLGSALCGIAWSLPALIFFRILQGLAGAGMIPMSITLLYSEFPPEERGLSMGALGVPLMVAPALGPSLGGYLVTFVSWRVIFYINVPIGILGFIMAAILLHNIRPARGRTPSFDIVGFFLSTVGLGAMLYALDKAGSDGWGSLTVETFMAIGAVSLVIFVIVELVIIENGGQPLLDLRVFASRTFAGGNLAMVTIVFALFAGQFMVPQYLQNLRGLSAYDAGLVLLPQALGSMVASLIGGRLVDRLGVKWVVIPGLMILATALWGMSRLTLQTPYSDFQILLILRGLGIGLSMQPTTVAALAETKPAQLSQASSVNSVVRSVGTSFAVAIVTTLITARTTFHSVRLAEQVTPESPTGQMLQHETSLATTAEVIQKIQQQAYMLAMNDAFLATLGIIFIAMLIVLFVVRTPRKKGVALSHAEHMALEGAPPIEEEEKQPVAVGSASSVAVASASHAAVGSTSSVAVASAPPATVTHHANGSKPGSVAHHANGSTPATVAQHANGSKPGSVAHQQSASTLTDEKPIKAPHQTKTILQKGRKDTPMSRLMQRSVIIPVLILAFLVVGGVISYLIYNSYNYYSTDDAQVTGTMVNIVPPISGTLTNLDVQVGSLVSAKQVIGTIQPLGLAPIQHLVAPIDGVMVQVPGTVGQLVSAGTIIAQETDPASMKITAYVDEGTIPKIVPGQVVDIHVDAYNTTVTGTVSQIVGATASQFSLLPTSDNSSGNYTKVSQRIPVNIQLDEAINDGSLFPGMSVEVTIHLH